jgi:hypothetical protein
MIRDRGASSKKRHPPKVVVGAMCFILGVVGEKTIWTGEFTPYYSPMDAKRALSCPRPREGEQPRAKNPAIA